MYVAWPDVATILASGIVAALLLPKGLRRLQHELDDGGLWFRLTAVVAAIVGVSVVLGSVVEHAVMFRILRLVYHAGAVVLPVIGVSFVWSAVRARIHGASKRVWIPTGVAGAALAALLPLSLWMTFVEPYRLQVERVTVEVPPQRVGERPIRIAVLSDFQTDGVGDYERHVVETLLSLEADLIVLPGDVLQRPYGEPPTSPAYEEMRALLRTLAAPAGVFGVDGDADLHFDALVRGTPVVPLHNETRLLQVGDRKLTLAGALNDYTLDATKNFVRQLETTPGDDDIRLLLAHRPAIAMQAVPDGPSRIDLVIAGHTHGGQVVLPFYGPLLTLSVAPRHIGAGGLHDLGGRKLYVSRGAGMERGEAPRMRLNCPPEVTLIELVPSGQR